MRLILPDRRIILPHRGWRPELLKPFVRSPFEAPGLFKRAPLQAAVGRTTLFSEPVNSGDPWTLVATPTLTLGHLLTITVTMQHFGGNPLSTGLTFNRGTWTVVTHVDDATNLHSIWTYYGLGDGSSGAFTISQVGGTGLKMANVRCQDWTGVDTGGTNGSNGIAQFKAIGPSSSANPQVISGSLDSVPAASSATYFVQSSGDASTPDGAFAEILDQVGVDYWLEDQWVTPAVQSVSATGASPFQPQIGIAIEIKADAPPPSTAQLMGQVQL